MKSVCDAPASETEAAEFERVRAENRYVLEQAEWAISNAKGEEFIPSVLEGADDTGDDYAAGDTQNYAPSADEAPRTLDEVTDIDSFRRFASQHPPPDVTGLRSDDQVETVRQGIDKAKYEYHQEQANKNLVASENRAQLRHRDYNILVPNFVEPEINRDWRVFEMLRYMPDPGEAAYRLAQILANGGRLPSTTHRRLNSLSQRDIDRMDAETFTEYLRTAKEGPEESEVDNREAIGREKMQRMNQLSIKDFEKELDRYKRDGD